LYNGINDHLFSITGVTDAKGKNLAFTIESNSKIKVGKTDANFVPPVDYQQWVLFLKCMRGDPGDNVFSAYPGVRVKGTKNQVGLTEAFEDRDRKGYAWNNLMLQRWSDHNGEEHRVLDDYNRNVTLVDLTAQPEDIRQMITTTIEEKTREPKNISQVGIRLLKFCQLYDMKKIMDTIQTYADPFQARYIK
jgi:hypothetical protein